jgi:hypothetical protein
MASRLLDPNQLAYDLFIAPSGDFLQATNSFTTSAGMAANGGIAQNSVPAPEPSTLALLGAGLLCLLAWRYRERVIA